MSYAIVRNVKMTRVEAQGICVHNDRKAKNHSNKEIDVTKTYLNYYIKKNELNYIKEFVKLKDKYDLKGQIRSNSIIMCEMVFTSDKEFFNKIGEKETKRYFDECYKFMCNYKNLGEKNIISAVIHLDEETPHMHLIYIPVIHTEDKNGNSIDKVCCRDFWKGRNSYRNLQNAYFDFVKSKGFDLERGLFVEETNREHLTIQQYKNITNFEDTKEKQKNIKLELPEVPELKDIRKVMLNRDEKIINEIIKPKDDLIKKLHQEKLELHNELSKQAKIIEEAEKYQKERENLITDNIELKAKCKKLELTSKEKEKELKYKYENEIYNKDYQYQRIIDKLEKENNYLKKVIERFKITVQKFISWVCHKFSAPSEEDLIRDFEKETYMNFDIEKQLDVNKFDKKEQEEELEYH